MVHHWIIEGKIAAHNELEWLTLERVPFGVSIPDDVMANFNQMDWSQVTELLNSAVAAFEEHEQGDTKT